MTLTIAMNPREVQLIKATLTVAAIAAIPWAADLSAASIVANWNVAPITASR
jgi:hypothetical protein